MFTQFSIFHFQSANQIHLLILTLKRSFPWLVLFYTVCFQMRSQCAWIRGRIVVLAAFVWLFSTVYFQMCPQSTWVSASIFTLVAFVRLFSTVCFQMCPQIACLNGCKVTLVAFVWLLSSVSFHMYPQRTWTQNPKQADLYLYIYVKGHIHKSHFYV